MKENEVQPTNSGRPEEEAGQDRELSLETDQDTTEVREMDPVTDSNPEKETVQVKASNSDAADSSSRNNGGNKGWMVASMLLAAALIIVLIFPPFGKDSGTEAVATVNNVEITKDKLYESLVEAGGQQTLNSLITEELIQQEVDKNAIKVTDEQINENVEALKAMFGSEDEFQNALASSGMTLDDLKQQAKTEVELTQLLGDKVAVTDEEVKEMYETYKDSFATPEQVRASHILVETEEEAKEIIKQINEGANFADIAAEKNQDATAQTGGDLGFFSAGQMDEAFEKAAFSMEVGELSQEPVKSSFGYHVIQVTDHKDATNPTYEDKKEDLRKQLVSSKVSEQYSTYVQELKDKAKISNTLEEKAAEEAETTKEASAAE